MESGEDTRKVRVEVHIPSADPDRESDRLNAVGSAVNELFDNHGFTVDPCELGELIHSSWHWREFFRREGAEVYEETKEALRRRQIDHVGAESFQAHAPALARLSEALRPDPEYVVFLGDVLIVKATNPAIVRASTV